MAKGFTLGESAVSNILGHRTKETEDKRNGNPAAAPVEPEEEKPEVELKTKRINFVIEPSLWDEFTKITYVQRVSQSEMLRSLVIQHINGNEKLLEEYKKIKG